jgi:hypothetical protein
LIFGFLEGFFEVIDRFIMVFNVFFLDKNWLKFGFFVKKNLNPDFAATTVAEIQANQTTHCLFFKKK